MIGTLIDAKYEVVRMLGSGGMAQVYEARHTGTNRRVAVKVITARTSHADQLIARFQREAKVAGAIDSEHIVQILDTGKDDKTGFPFLVMELLEGEDLDRVIQRIGPVTPTLALRVIAQACVGVQKAHDAGVVHRDIKPANIFAARRDEGKVVIKVLDFGIAKVVDDVMSLPASALTSTNSLLGSPLYMSPEQARGFKDIDHRTDVFSLGVVLYAMLTGKVPHADVTAIGELILAICSKPARRVEEVAPWVKPEAGAVVHRALTIERADRYQTVAALLDAIRPLIDDEMSLKQRMFVGIGEGPRTEGVISSDPEKKRDSFTLGDTNLSAELRTSHPLGEEAPPRQEDPRASSNDAPIAPASVSVTGRETKVSEGAMPVAAESTGETVAKIVATASTQDTAPGAAKDATVSRPPRRISTALGVGVGAAVIVAGLAGWDLWSRAHGAKVEAGGATAPSASVSARPKDRIDEDVLRSFSALPAVVTSSKNPLNDEKLALGRMLFYDARLSKAHDVSCASCHALDKYGTDGLRFSPGHAQMQGTRNSLTVYNAAGFFALMWDGRFENIEKQAAGPITTTSEMAQTPEKVEAVLRSIPGYVSAFPKAFPGEKAPLSFDNAMRAIGAFERKLLTPGRWDKFLQGDRDALTSAEKAGFNTFVDVGCVQCHSGTYIGASSFQKLGLVKAWGETRDRGRFEVTKEESDFMVFRVPSLRNVAMTAPYFHDGGITSLDEAVRMMARHQIGKEITAEQVASIVTWLKALTGDLPLEYARKPELFPSGRDTPKPAKD